MKTASSSRNQAEQRRRLIEIAELMLAGRTFAEIHQVIGSSLQFLLDYDEFGSFKLEPETGVLRPSQFVDGAWEISRPHTFTLRVGQGIAGKVAQIGQAILRNNAHRDPLSMYPPEYRPAIDHLIALPIHTEERVTGTLSINRYRDPPFTDEEFEIAQIFVNLLSLALTNSRLFEKIGESERGYRRLFEESIDVIYVSRPDGTIVDVNPAGIELLGYPDRETMLQQNIEHNIYVDPAERELFRHLIEKHGSVTGLESRRRRYDGRIIFVEENATAVRNERGEVTAYHGFLRDVTRRKRAEERLIHTSEQLRLQVEELQRREREMSAINRMSIQLHECYSFDTACETAAVTISSIVEAAAGGIYLRTAHGELQRRIGWGRVELLPTLLGLSGCLGLSSHPRSDEPSGRCALCAMGQCRYADALCLPIWHHRTLEGMLVLNQPGRMMPTNAQRVLLEMALRPLELTIANLHLRASLQEQAIHDPLTKLFNRRYLEEALERELYRAGRHQTSLGLMMLDLDYFKRINDTYGHLTGDHVLQRLSAFLLTHIRGEDIACRYGGEEFLLILPGSSVDHTFRRAQQIGSQTHALLITPLPPEDDKPPKLRQPLTFTLSIGVASFPEHGTTAEQLLSQADLALYQAKSQGRNQVVMANPPSA